MSAIINLKSFAIKLSRSIMLNTGKKITHLDSSDDSDEDGKEKQQHSSETNFMNSATKALISSVSSPLLLRSLTSESSLCGCDPHLTHTSSTSSTTTISSLDGFEFKDKPIFHLGYDFEQLPSMEHEHGTVLFR